MRTSNRGSKCEWLVISLLVKLRIQMYFVKKIPFSLLQEINYIHKFPTKAGHRLDHLPVVRNFKICAF